MSKDPYEDEEHGMVFTAAVCLLFWAALIYLLLYSPFKPCKQPKPSSRESSSELHSSSLPR